MAWLRMHSKMIKVWRNQGCDYQALRSMISHWGWGGKGFESTGASRRALGNWQCSLSWSRWWLLTQVFAFQKFLCCPLMHYALIYMCVIYPTYPPQNLNNSTVHTAVIPAVVFCVGLDPGWNEARICSYIWSWTSHHTWYPLSSSSAHISTAGVNF